MQTVGKLSQKTEICQIIFKECTRLVCNTILYYNSVILSRIYTNFLKNGDHAQITALKSISPCSWININLYGLFELKNYFNTTISEIKTDDFKESLLKNDHEGFAKGSFSRLYSL